MKAIKTTVLCFTLILLGATTSTAQVKVNLNINLQPLWGPASYNYVEYYFLPEIGIYYSVPQQMFIYPVGNHWKYSSKLPAAYQRYNLYNTYKVVLNSPKPYLHHKEYVKKYGNYHGKKQQNIRDYNNVHIKYKNKPGKQGYEKHANNGRGHGKH